MKLHDRNHIIKSVLGNAEHAFTHSGLKKNELTVVNYHGTQKKFSSNFRQQINFFQKNFTIIFPTQLQNFYGGKLTGERPFLLLTFDDGIKNNLNAAAILSEYNLKAFFFIVPDFIDTPIESQKNYFTTHIRPKINEAIDNEMEDFTSLNWDDLKKLLSNGHAIGSHTTSHSLIAKKSSLENSSREIKDCKKMIAAKLNVPAESIDSFCSINNTLESIALKELKIIKENYSYHFTTIPGVNFPDSDPYFIKRANIESHWLSGAVKYAIGKWDVKRWGKSANEYLKILKEAK